MVLVAQLNMVNQLKKKSKFEACTPNSRRSSKNICMMTVIGHVFFFFYSLPLPRTCTCTHAHTRCMHRDTHTHTNSYVLIDSKKLNICSVQYFLVSSEPEIVIILVIMEHLQKDLYDLFLFV